MLVLVQKLNGPVKFDKKAKIDNSIRNNPQSFQSNTHHLDKVMINLGLIKSFFDP